MMRGLVIVKLLFEAHVLSFDCRVFTLQVIGLSVLRIYLEYARLQLLLQVVVLVVHLRELFLHIGIVFFLLVEVGDHHFVLT